MISLHKIFKLKKATTNFKVKQHVQRYLQAQPIKAVTCSLKQQRFDIKALVSLLPLHLGTHVS